MSVPKKNMFVAPANALLLQALIWRPWLLIPGSERYHKCPFPGCETRCLCQESVCPFSCHLCPCRIFSCLYSSYKTPAPATNSLLRRSSTPSLNSMVHQPSPRPHPQLLRLHLHHHQHHHLHLHLPAHIYVHHAFVHFLRQLLWFLSVLSIH